MGSKRIRSRKKNGKQISMKSVLLLLKYVRKYTPGYLALELLLVIGNSVWDILVGMLYVKYLFDALEKGAGLPTGSGGHFLHDRVPHGADALWEMDGKCVPPESKLKAP